MIVSECREVDVPATEEAISSPFVDPSACSLLMLRDDSIEIEKSFSLVAAIFAREVSVHILFSLGRLFADRLEDLDDFTFDPTELDEFELVVDMVDRGDVDFESNNSLS